LFNRGQDWGFPPLHPQKMRETWYQYPIAYLKHHMKYAGILRVDHMMGIHHLFWVPKDMEATEGVYVRYPADELYAILSIESHKHKCLVVGENLGTVPSYVNDAMARHNVYGMYVAQYELAQDADRSLRAVPANALATLNTHDMPPFSAFWQSLDIERRIAMGLANQAESKTETESRHAAKRALARSLQQTGHLKGDPGDVGVVLKGCLSFLADSAAQVFLVNLEDLWLEAEPQNVPGVVEGYPNWQRKARYDFDTFSKMPEVAELLERARRPLDLGKRR
jgi:4-alpha-glucanotransferase